MLGGGNAEVGESCKCKLGEQGRWNWAGDILLKM